MSDIRPWLEKLGLGQYADAFEANAISLDLAHDLSDQDLKDLGVTAMGHRKALLRAITDPEASSSPTPQPGAATDQAPHTTEAERRQLTVMFCDLVGSTELSARLDPEDLREVMRAYQDACAGAIERFDGHIAQTLGDGLMVYFGYPVAHEDDAQRAVRAGMAILEVIAALDAQMQAQQSVKVAVRIGVHTGLVVAGELGGHDTRADMAIVGETPNVAARLQALAEPNTVVMGARTRHLAGDVFEFQDLGARPLKGMPEPMVLYQVGTERAAESRSRTAKERPRQISSNEANISTAVVGRSTKTILSE